MADFSTEQKKALALANARMRLAEKEQSQSLQSPEQNNISPSKLYSGLVLRTAGTALGGIADLPSMAINAGEYIGEKLSGKIGTPRAPYPSTYIEKGMTAAGLPEPETLPQKIGVYGAPLLAAGASSLLGGIKNIAKGITASSPEEMTATGQALKNASQAAYQKMKDIGANINSDSATNLMKNVFTEISKAGKFNKNLHAGTQSVLEDLTAEINSGNPLSLESLDQSRRLLQAVISKDTVRSQITNKIISVGEDAQRAKTAIKAIDDSVNSLKNTDLISGSTEAINTLNQGRSLWSQNRKYGDISRIIEESGGNPNNLKLRLTRLVNDKNKMNLFSDAEQQTIKNAATTTGGEALLNLAGKFGIDLGSSVYQGRAMGAVLTPLIAKGIAGGGAGYAAGGKEGATVGAIAAIAGGTVARQLQKWIASGKAEDILKIIQSGNKLTPAQISKLSPKNAKLYLGAASTGGIEKGKQ